MLLLLLAVVLLVLGLLRPMLVPLLWWGGCRACLRCGCCLPGLLLPVHPLLRRLLAPKLLHPLQASSRG
jgi:hypothetical protein